MIKKLTLKMRRRTPPQKRISESLKRFNVALWGRQSGKTTFGLDKMTYRPLQGRTGGIYWYVLQTFSAAEVAFKRFYEMHINSGLFAKKPNMSDLYFNIIGNRTIFFKSGEVFQNLRAETLDGACVDEYRQQKPGLWTQILRPMLARRGGWCDFFSTGNGFDHFYDLYEFAKKNPDEWATFHAPSTEAWWWDETEVASAKATMSQAEFDQEIMAEFRDLTRGKAYGCYGEWNESYSSPLAARGLVNPILPIYVCLDFNVAPMAWTLGQTHKKIFYAFDMVYIPRTVKGTFEAAQVLVEKLKTYEARTVILIGDATGKADKSSAAGETDYSIIAEALNKAGFEWENITPESNPPVKDRVNCFNAHLKAADGTVRFFLHPVNCAPLRVDCQKVVWKEGTGKLWSGTDGTLTHASDGVGYWVNAIDPIKLHEDSFEIAVV